MSITRFKADAELVKCTVLSNKHPKQPNMFSLLSNKSMNPRKYSRRIFEKQEPVNLWHFCIKKLLNLSVKITANKFSVGWIDRCSCADFTRQELHRFSIRWKVFTKILQFVLHIWIVCFVDANDIDFDYYFTQSANWSFRNFKNMVLLYQCEINTQLLN